MNRETAEMLYAKARNLEARARDILDALNLLDLPAEARGEDKPGQFRVVARASLRHAITDLDSFAHSVGAFPLEPDGVADCPGCGEPHRDGHGDSCACDHCPPEPAAV